MRCFLRAAFLFLALSSASHAGILADLISFGGSDTVLEDNSRGLIYDEDSDDELSEGDVITGILRIDRRISPTPTASLDDSMQLLIVYSFEVDEVGTLSGVFDTLKYKPTSAATGKDLKSLLGDSHEPGGFADWDKATFVVMEQTFGSNDPANNPVSNTTTAGATLIDGVLADGSGYVLDAIVGMETDDDFYHHLITGAPGLDLADILSADGSVTWGMQSGGFTVLHNTLDPGTKFKPVDATSVIDNSASTHDVGLEGGLLFGNNESNWDFADKANVRINVIPEPTSLGLCGLLLGCLGLGRMSRRV